MMCSEHPSTSQSQEEQSNNATTTTASNSPQRRSLKHQVSSGLHRRRTLYLVRHGEALHNVREHQAQEQARRDAEVLNHLDPDQIEALMERARMSVLHDPNLRDAPLTERGRAQVRKCGQRLQDLIDQGIAHPPTEAMVSPLSRTLETCQILLDTVSADVKAHIREEIQERQTQFPPDTVKSRQSLLRFSQSNDRFLMDHIDMVPQEDIDNEARVRESKDMLRERASGMFNLLLEMKHRHILIVSHKGYLRELERGLLGLHDSPLFENAELRVYKVVFTRGDRALDSLERVA